MNRVHDFHSRVSGLWNFIGLDTPNRRDVTPSFRVCDGALAWKLVAFLAMFSPTLSVALSRNHDAPGTRATDVTCRQAQIDEAKNVLDSLGMMLESPSVHRKSSLGFCKPMGSLLDGVRRNSRNARGRCRIPGLCRLRYGFEAGGVLLDE